MFLLGLQINTANNTLSTIVKNNIGTETTMTDENRVKLDTAIEKEVHKLVHSISEGVYDRVQLQARKQNLPIEPEVLTHILKMVQISITEFEFKNIDRFHANIKQKLDDYVGEENPTDLLTTAESTTKKVRSRSATV